MSGTLDADGIYLLSWIHTNNTVSIILANTEELTIPCCLAGTPDVNDELPGTLDVNDELPCLAGTLVL